MLEAKNPRPTRRTADKWESARFQAFFWLRVFFGSPAEAQPAHSRLRQIVGWLTQQGHKIKIQRLLKIMQRFFGIILLFIMLSACSQTTETSLPVETLQPTMSSIVTETPVNSASTSTCPAETTELKLFTNANDGFCFLYPIEDTAFPPYMVVINPNGISGGDFLPGDALVEVNIEAASGRTAAQVADEKIAEAGEGFNITRSEILIDGKQAIVVDGLPAQDPWREVFIVDNDRLYILFFEPWTPNADWFSKLENLYSSVIDSFHVFPPMP